MKKAFLWLLAATAGCAVGGRGSDGVTHDGQIATAETVGAPASDDGDGDGNTTAKLPKRRFVPPSNGDGNSNAGGGTTIGGSSTWQRLTNQPTFYAGTALLLTDGSVMVQDVGTPNWWKLTPDATGSYLNGALKQLAPMPNGYAPLYFASAVLPDGRVIVEGGEYQNFEPDWGTRGAIYDPTRDQWTEVAPPAGWEYIGDAQSIVLPDGRFLLASCCTTQAATLDPKTLTWTPFGSGKADIFDEEGWTLLPDNRVLTVDANNLKDLTASEILNPDTQVWSSAGSTIVQLDDTRSDDGGSHELGPAILRPDGTVIAMGATAHTSIYNTASGSWTPGPDFPIIPGQGQLDIADGPAVLLPNGDVLAVASPGLFSYPSHVLRFDGSKLDEIAAPPGAASDSSFNVNLLLLPSGEVLFTDFSNDLELYAPPPASASQAKDWGPQVSPMCDLRQLAIGSTRRIAGTRLNGLSQAVAYGDDAQAATNYPLVRITNVATGHVVYARTHHHTSAAIGLDVKSATSFDVPLTAELGPSKLVVVTNGIASDPVSVTIARTGSTLSFCE